ncbi:hypothetical protein [uncultured Devosia sp.]|uniref:hypothetical protein n=1 Tax=uncultured Devosia sp. TaxID=211434 RepID=UPI0035CC3907
MRQIGIDLEVHRAIENGRIAFGEDENAILRRLLRIDGMPRLPAEPRLVPRQPRSSGAYWILLENAPIEANSLKELLRRVLLKAERIKPGTIAQIAAMPTARGRFVVASSAAQLYPKAPHLVEFGEPLGDGWWYDTNVGRNQMQAYLRVVAALLGLASIPQIGKRSEKTTMTAADLGL